MATFTPPTDNLVQYANRNDLSVEHRLFKFLAPTARGRNVFKLNDLSYVQNEPSDMTSILITYHGGHSHTVSVDEAAALTAAGYGANLT